MCVCPCEYVYVRAHVHAYICEGDVLPFNTLKCCICELNVFHVILKSLFLCMYVCMYVRMYVCLYVCIYVCMYVFMYVRMYVCMYVCRLTKLNIVHGRHLKCPCTRENFMEAGNCACVVF